MVRITRTSTWSDRSIRKTRMLPVVISLSAILFIIGSNSGIAQLSGNYTIGAGQTYTSVADFVSALNTSGVSGPVTATVLPGVYQGNISINAITGATISSKAVSSIINTAVADLKGPLAEKAKGGK